jgi:sulfoquinovosyltransferase
MIIGNSGAARRSSSPDAPPPLKRHAPRKVCLMVEPTPFTHVSGYANRFQEMLKYLAKAGDQVDILTVDSKTPVSQLPSSFQNFTIQHTQGFTFPLYNSISLSLDLPELQGARLLEQGRPELIHVTSPGFLLFAALFYARVLKIPLVMSYHTHLPSYGKFKKFCFSLSSFIQVVVDSFIHWTDDSTG